ncbi:MAG: tetratricopeptide repeat protein [Desulfovibrionales bacterium]|nr:tetratricopeptide repeat protein [Desulfovibrionales bacterium]
MKEGNKEAVLLLAQLYIVHKKEEKATVLLEGLQELFPRDEYVARALAWLYYIAGKYKQSLEQLDLWMRTESAPDPVQARIAALIRSSVLKKLGKSEDAKSAMEDFFTLTAEAEAMRS